VSHAAMLGCWFSIKTNGGWRAYRYEWIGGCVMETAWDGCVWCSLLVFCYCEIVTVGIFRILYIDFSYSNLFRSSHCYYK
jgi:hypothetical protein